MEYRIETWKISDLIEKYNDDHLILNPPYQRNYIWSLNDQRTLIDSILKGHPIPIFFFLEKDDHLFEIVDGQQRTRTIIGYFNKLFSKFDGQFFDDQKEPNFLNYSFPVTIISKIKEDESIEKFYSMVNSSGVHLNRPEILTAKHFDTNFLKVINDFAGDKRIKSLGIFTDTALKRMNDIDYMSEIATLILSGHTDKKIKVDQYYSSDINEEEEIKLRTQFNRVVDIILNLNKIYPIAKTRYKQKNDFYSLFSFLLKNSKLPLSELIYFYKILVIIGKDIKPTQEECEPFKNYALNCVTQSNSKAARDERLDFLESLFLNKKNVPSKIQKSILKYYNLNTEDVKKIGDFLTIDLGILSSINDKIVFLD